MTTSGPARSRLILIIPAAAALQSVMLIRNVLVLPPPAATVMPLMQVVLIIGLLGLWRWVAGRSDPEEALTAAIPIVVALVGLLLPLEQALTGNGLLAANLALVLVVGGALIVRVRDLILCCAILDLAWVGAVLTRDTWEITVADQLTYVTIGTLIGLAVHLLRASDRARLERARDAAIRSAMRDHLTGLWNRRGLSAILPSMIGAARENGVGMWCLFIDVRGLKQLNDTAGHTAGDRLLAAIGQALTATEILGGVPSRWGGDEFCVLGVGTPPHVPAAHRKLVANVAEVYEHRREWDLSLGLNTTTSFDADVLARLVQGADEDMYRRRGDAGFTNVGMDEDPEQ